MTVRSGGNLTDMPDTTPPERGPERHHDAEVEGDEAVDDVIEFFEASGDKDSPTSDSDAAPPG
jgi:hypothetical protein